MIFFKRCIIRILFLMLSVALGAYPLRAAAPRESKEETMDMRARILYGLEHCEAEIYLHEYQIPKTEAVIVYRHLLENQPQLFYVGNTFSYTYDPQGYIMSLFPAYLMDGETLADCRQSMCLWLEEVRLSGGNYASDGDKALFIHDYLAKAFTYSPAGEENYDVYSLLTEGHGVCQAFSLAFIALGRCMALEVDMVTSVSMDHAWNHVTVNGEVYHVDVTRDLPTHDQAVRHERFLLCDEAMAALGYEDYTCAQFHACEDHRYETMTAAGVHQGMLGEIQGTLLYVEPLWLGLTFHQTLLQWSLGSQKEKEVYPQEGLDLNGDGQLSLSDILLPAVQQAPDEAALLTEALRRQLMLGVLTGVAPCPPFGEACQSSS